ncbi:MAG: hypothetical protein O3B13_01245 [Planctomycetota bacterium]|nr:hypothetical protein [Planctomycetota bacterium]
MAITTRLTWRRPEIVASSRTWTAAHVQPFDEQSRQDALAILKGRAEAMRSAGSKRKQ